MKKIALGADHGGYELKEAVKQHLQQRGIPFEDFGCHSTESVDYPDMAVPPCRAVQQGDCDCALLFCGSLPEKLLGCFTCALVIIMHRSNIRRLIAGTEPKFHAGKRPKK